jgi:hypothetical protein
LAVDEDCRRYFTLAGTFTLTRDGVSLMRFLGALRVKHEKPECYLRSAYTEMSSSRSGQ